MIDEIETFAVMTEDQYIINVGKAQEGKGKSKAQPAPKINLGSVRISKARKIPHPYRAAPLPTPSLS